MHPTIARHVAAVMADDAWLRHTSARWRAHLAAYGTQVDRSTVDNVWSLIRRYERYEDDAAIVLDPTVAA